MRAVSARRLLSGLCLAGCLVSAIAQEPDSGRVPSIRIGPISIYENASQEERVALGNDVTIPEGTEVRSVVVVGGNAVIEGKVRGEVVVVLGGLKLGPKAEVGREVVLIGGPYEEADGAEVGRERVLITWPAWGWFNWVGEWVRDGVFWARPLPHQHPWAWIMAGVSLLVYLLLAALFPGPLDRCREALEVQPGSAFVLGLLTFLLLGPLLLLLTVSVVGLLAIPFLLLLLVFALLLGKASVYQFTGCQLVGHRKMPLLNWSVTGLVLGCVLFSLLYAVPVLGFLLLGLVSILGLGAVILAMFRWSNQPPVLVEGSNLTVAGATLGGTALETNANARVVQLERGGFWIRFWATFLDAVLIGAFLLAVQGQKFVFLVWALYHFAFWTWRGTTIGGIVMGIRIIRKDGRPIDYAVALVRCVSALFSALVIFIGFFWAGWDRERQSWHDKIAGTLVVRVPKASLV